MSFLKRANEKILVKKERFYLIELLVVIAIIAIRGNVSACACERQEQATGTCMVANREGWPHMYAVDCDFSQEEHTNWQRAYNASALLTGRQILPMEAATFRCQ